MKKIIFLLVLIGTLWSCTPQESHVKFKVQNNAGNKIYLQYHALQSTDTMVLQIIPNQSTTIWDAHREMGNGSNSNWYEDFGIEIIHISNLWGESTTFNPNIASHWNMSSADEVNYILVISDSSF